MYRTAVTPPDFDGSLVLEKIAAIGKTDEFFEALDTDDFTRARSLMKAAGIEAETIATTLRKMIEADDEH